MIGPDVALRLAGEDARIAEGHKLVAPTLLRSQVLSLLYRSAQRGDLTRKDADRQLNYLRALRIRLLGDRVSQSVAWRIAAERGWADTYDAEYVAVTQLQADSFVTLDKRLADSVGDLVNLAPVEDLYP
ncbi:type II toxin-antitoxin system VapC family toxin [Virgisporangium ochraceum]|uniref:type II toxin-antitoxin system VapC family toxin n=1 Tax=Virgisporangium ochraceum TaxID=65505 RepID=UPI0019425CA8|nr:type II toxin-antitoxin system VapC family toxin [Virgisporangium ochraceum]